LIYFQNSGRLRRRIFMGWMNHNQHFALMFLFDNRFRVKLSERSIILCSSPWFLSIINLSKFQRSVKLFWNYVKHLYCELIVVFTSDNSKHEIDWFSDTLQFFITSK
jgi:hypothetical protein